MEAVQEAWSHRLEAVLGRPKKFLKVHCLRLIGYTYLPISAIERILVSNYIIDRNGIGRYCPISSIDCGYTLTCQIKQIYDQCDQMAGLF